MIFHIFRRSLRKYQAARRIVAVISLSSFRRMPNGVSFHRLYNAFNRAFTSLHYQPVSLGKLNEPKACRQWCININGAELYFRQKLLILYLSFSSSVSARLRFFRFRLIIHEAFLRWGLSSLINIRA